MQKTTDQRYNIKAILIDAGGVLYLNNQGAGFLNTELVEFIRAYQKRYRFGIISTTNYDLDAILKKDGIRELFNIVLTSGATNFDKTEVGIYKYAISLLGVEPEEAVFIDNENIYTETANSIGIKTILYSEFKTCYIQLMKLLNP